jgi:hypothetical protein
LLINGFADQAVDEVPIESVRRWIAERLGHDTALDTGIEAIGGNDDA